MVCTRRDYGDVNVIQVHALDNQLNAKRRRWTLTGRLADWQTGRLVVDW